MIKSKEKSNLFFILFVASIMTTIFAVLISSFQPAYGAELIETIDNASGSLFSKFCELFAGKLGRGLAFGSLILYFIVGEKKKPIFGTVAKGAFIVLIFTNVYVYANGDELVKSAVDWIADLFNGTASST